MSPYASYQLFQAERLRGAAEIREADAALGELAAFAHLLGRWMRRPVKRPATPAGACPPGCGADPDDELEALDPAA
ncbi:MAG TPA: hypothetical protein VEK76_11335 [Candidatus Binatia bacterium]|nr:hypothetical protein [Candidatus Binatia bacterium]